MSEVVVVSTIAGCISAVGGVLYVFYKIARRFEMLEDQSKCRKEESVILIKSTFAMLDGLTQLGANGSVSHAKAELQAYIIKKGD